MDRCIIPRCDGNGMLFRVPIPGSNRFSRWIKVAILSGTSDERICSQHFSEADFIKNIRNKLKTTAVPTMRLPAGMVKAKEKKGCCVAGCRTKNKANMEKFATAKSRAWTRWTEILGCSGMNTAKWKICHQHFTAKDFTTVTSRYLKDSAVPTKNLQRPIKSDVVHRRKDKTYSIPQCLLEHNYAMEDLRPKSNRMCSVFGCTVKSSKGVFLHRFPKERTIINRWTHAIKLGTKPTKNSFVCSQHFHGSDYNTGTNILKKNAVPSVNIPLTLLKQVQARREDPYKRFPETSRRSTIERNSDSSLSYDRASDDNQSLETSASTINSNAGPSVLCKGNDSADITTDALNSEFHDDLPPYQACLNDSNRIVSDTEDQTRAEQIERTPDENKLERSIRKHGTAILSDFLITEKHLTTWTGISSMKLLEVLCAMARTMEDNVYPKSYKMHITDRIILTLVKVKQNISFSALSTIFCISPTTAAEYFYHTVQVLAEILGTMIYWPSREEIKQNIPHCFKGKFENVRCILDCTEISITSPNCLNCRIACYSNYKHKRTVKILLGVTPAGLISFCSRAYSGKSSDKFIFNKENFIDKLEKHQDAIMTDKGFAIEKECAEKGIRLHIPPFLREKKLSAEDALLNESIAKARVHVERAISRMKSFGVLQGSIDPSVLRHIDDIMKIICGIVNLSAPILKDDKF
ncbi:uncharacterized protein LOC134227628 isoform X2 [Armigeres subalbatus]|uniref:uncharacterized protein LOC134227628 isoform X2 n=1 Tax=Armigeres subalbatus TaxID=124917 RepID=UPI002ED0BF53